jgi:hypothetical protein
LILALACGACAHGGEPRPRDATQDPEFQAALKRAKPEFPRQSEALAAGLYEPFVPPESLPASPVAGFDSTELAAASSTPRTEREAPPPVDASRARPTEGPASSGARTSTAAADPSTEDLLRTLPSAPRAHPSVPSPVAPAKLDGPATDRADDEARPPAVSDDAESPDGRAREPAPDSVDGDASDALAGLYTIQVGAFGDAAAAARRAQEARDLAPDLSVDVRRQDGWLKVFVGRFASREEGEAVLRKLAARGLDSGWVTRVLQ